MQPRAARYTWSYIGEGRIRAAAGYVGPLRTRPIWCSTLNRQGVHTVCSATTASGNKRPTPHCSSSTSTPFAVQRTFKPNSSFHFTVLSRHTPTTA